MSKKPKSYKKMLASLAKTAKLTNDQMIESHGFNLKTSFRKRKQ